MPSQHWQKGEIQVRKMGENCSCFLLLLLIVVSIDLLLLQSRTRNVKGITWIGLLFYCVSVVVLKWILSSWVFWFYSCHSFYFFFSTNKFRGRGYYQKKDVIVCFFVSLDSTSLSSKTNTGFFARTTVLV